MEYVYKVPLTGICHEMVLYNYDADGNDVILINADLCPEQQLEAYKHARMHLDNHHFCDGGNADAIEAITHGKGEL